MQKKLPLLIALFSCSLLSLQWQIEQGEAATLRFSNPELSSPSALRNERKNPCANFSGIALRACVVNANRSAGESRRTSVLKRNTAGGRRLSALTNRKDEQTSAFDSPVNPGERVNLSERPFFGSQSLQHRSNPSTYVETGDSPLLPRRARAGTRQDKVELPVCSRRDGLRLIRCLQESSIRITPDTAGQETWELYQRLYLH
ncbi:MAG TPA: hypothetical protein VJB60_02440 [Candidatus Peribacterales bacterium]|nr:hypothetical protein [Candidatus Peribacterales bacterium]